MTDIVIGEIIAVIPSTLLSIAAILTVLKRVEKVQEKLNDNSIKLDGRLSQLVDVISKERYAAGVKAETDREK